MAAVPLGEPTDVAEPPPWLATLVAHAQDAVAAFDGGGQIHYVNDAAVDLLRSTRAELLARPVLDLVSEEDQVRAVTTIASVGAGGRPRPGLVRLKLGDGTWARLELTPWLVDLPGPPGGPGPLTAVVLRDNTFAEAHWEFLAALTAGEPFHRCIEVLAASLSHGSDGPMGIAYDQDGRRRGAGPLAADLMGLTADGGIDDDPSMPWSRALSTGQPVWGPTAELPEPIRTRALALGGPAYVAVPVTDPANERPAVIVQWPSHESMASVLGEALARRPLQAVTLALQRRDDLDRLERQARRDGLTDLLNRDHFFATLDDLVARGVRFGVCYVDLDHFKPINDTHGHLVGDDVLVACARRIEEVVGPRDLVARLGGDEFAVACPEVDTAELDGVAARIVDSLGGPLLLDGLEVATGASVGCALGDPGDPADSVVAAADRALYDAKRAGRATWLRADPLSSLDPDRPVRRRRRDRRAST